jgi:hypothetical protein
MPNLQLGLPAGLSSPYLVAQSDWIAIDNRVTLVIEMQQIATVIKQYIPNYPDLLDVCTAWRETTFPDLIAQAVTTNLFATNAAQTLERLSAELAGLTPTDPVPDPVRSIIRVQVKALAQSAGQQAAASAGLQQPIAAFVSANRATDAALRETPLDGWSSVAGSISSVEGAMANVQQSWASISTRLAAASGDQVQVTATDLLSIDFQAAIAGWTALGNAAAAFDSMVSGLNSTSAG